MENENDFWNNYIYSDHQTIMSELESRRNNPKLKKAVEEFWGELAPEFLAHSENPSAFFARPFITPNMETRFFLDIASSFKAEPVLMEFPHKFATVNKAKYHLAKTHHFGTSKRGKKTIEKRKHVDFASWEGAPLAQVEMPDGRKLRELHHEWFNESFPEHSDKIVDISEWFDSHRNGHDGHYYLGFLALGLYHGIIFENFMLDDPREREFFMKKVVPSYHELERIFGIKPLISPVLPIQCARFDEWYHYPNT